MSRWQAQNIRTSRAPVWPRWLALGLFLVALFLLVRITLNHLHKKPVVAPAPVEKTQTTQPAQASPALPQPVQFDFYTVLPKMEVSSPAPPPTDSPPIAKAKPVATTVAPSPTHSPAPVAKPLPASVGMYVLQIAAVRQQQDAERLRDQMRGAGYSAFIQPYQTDQALWYRVMVGPFASQDLAEHNQAQLKSQGTHSLILKMQPRE